MSDHVDIPPEFWQSLTEEEFLALVESPNGLSKGMIARLWRILGRKDAPPESMSILLNKLDLDKILAGDA